MTPRDFCQQGQAEWLKGGVHATAALVLGVMGGYNATAAALRREPRLGFLALLYASWCAFEISKTLHHWDRTCAR